MLRAFQLAACTAVLATLAGAPVCAQAPALGRIDAPLVGVRNLGKGQLVCLLYRRVDRIDADTAKAWQIVRLRPSATELVVRFEAVPPGEYAVAVFHDMDGDGKLTSNFLGVPKEDLAVSRNAKGGPLGGPKWDLAKVRLVGDALRLEPLSVHPFYD